MIINNLNSAETQRITTKSLSKMAVESQNALIRVHNGFISEGQKAVNDGAANKVSFAEVRNFLVKLFKSRKAKEKNDPFIQISDKFTPHERELILGDEKDLKVIREMISKQKTPFMADLIENPDKSVRKAVFHIGSKTLYIDMNKASDDEISTMVNNLIYYPFEFYR